MPWRKLRLYLQLKKEFRISFGQFTEANLQDGDSIVEIEGKRYLQTSSDRELAILQQASFDESKLAFLAQWWKGIGGMDSGIGEITNLTNFIRSRTFKVVDANGSEVSSGDKQTQRLIKQAVDIFKVSSLRQGRDSDHQYMGMNALNRASNSNKRFIENTSRAY